MKRWIKSILISLEYNFGYLRVLNSPFKWFKLRVYIGKTNVGVPYFLPRKWRKFTQKDIVEAAEKAMNNSYFVKKTKGEWHAYYKNYKKAVPLTVGFSYCGLGWKTKWEDTDYRHEYNPAYSFVFFGYQIAIMVCVRDDYNYWGSWLYYDRDTDKTKSKEERLLECMKGFPNIWKQTSKGKEETINYYTRILKKKYLHLIPKP